MEKADTALEINVRSQKSFKISSESIFEGWPRSRNWLIFDLQWSCGSRLRLAATGLALVEVLPGHSATHRQPGGQRSTGADSIPLPRLEGLGTSRRCSCVRPAAGPPQKRLPSEPPGVLEEVIQPLVETHELGIRRVQSTWQNAETTRAFPQHTKLPTAFALKLGESYRLQLVKCGRPHDASTSV